MSKLSYESMQEHNNLLKILEFPNCKHLKLPANYLIKNTNFLDTEICPLLPYGEYPKTFLELFKWKQNGYIFLHFDFYNGACSTKQLNRLQAAIKEIGRDKNANVLILMGGSTYFGNGINLNTIEVSNKVFLTPQSGPRHST